MITGAISGEGWKYMKETIVLAPGLNGNELLKSLALLGVNSFNLRICGAGELARMALMRSGVSIKEDFLSMREETALVAEAIAGDAYFGKASFSDVERIAGAIRQVRCLAGGENEERTLRETLGKGIFKEKNTAILKAYCSYMKILADRGAIDAVSLMRRALEQSSVIDADFLYLEEYPLNPLERLLLDHVSGGSAKRTTIQTIFRTTTKPLVLESIKNCYGAPNEAETVIADIYAGKILGESMVAVTDVDTYGQLFFDYALLYNLPVTFGCGIPIMNSNPARLLVLYYKWITDGFFGADAIHELLTNSAFNREELNHLLPEQDEGFNWGEFYNLLGELRLTNDGELNRKRLAEFKKALEEERHQADANSEKTKRTVSAKESCLPMLELMAKELALPAEDFITKYARIRKGGKNHADKLIMELDLAAKTAIYDELKVIRSSGVEQDAEDIILTVLKMRVCHQQSCADKLHVTSVDSAFATLRKNNFVMGLSASKFPGSPKEDYLLLDADLRLFGDEAEYLTADGRIIRKREKLLSLVRLLSSLDLKVSLSYAGLNVSELKRDNASSMVFELYREQSGANATSQELDEHTVKVDYFVPAISVTRLVGAAYNNEQHIERPEPINVPALQQVGYSLEKAYSPSALDTFFNCPRRFLLSYILGIPEPEDYNPFETLSATDRGILAHSLMEVLSNSTLNSEEFLALCGNSFDRFVAGHPPLLRENTDAIREQFLEMMETAYSMDPHREVVLEEEDIYAEHETGVKLHGYPDRVEKQDDGTYHIVDFKSGRRVVHQQDDIGTCLQILIYAYLFEKKGYKVSGGEYRYISLGETVTCRYDEEMRNQLSERMQAFKEHMLSGDFPLAEVSEDGVDPCQYCGYSSACGKGTEEEEAI